MAYSKPEIMLGLAGIASSSTGTSNPLLVGDCRFITISVQSAATVQVSRFTVSGSNNHGMNSQDSTLVWSVLTTILNQGMYTLDPGAQWLQVERPAFSTSAASNATIILNRYYE